MTLNHYLNNRERYNNYDSNGKYTKYYSNHYMIYSERYNHFTSYISYLTIKTPSKRNYSFTSTLRPPPHLPPKIPPLPPHLLPPPRNFTNKDSTNSVNFKYSYKSSKDAGSQTENPKKSSIYYLPPIKDRKTSSTSTDMTIYDNLFKNIFKNIEGYSKNTNGTNISKENKSDNNDDSDNEEDDTDIEKTYEILEKPIKCLGDLIRIGKDYKKKYCDKTKRYNLNVKRLSKMVNELTDLNNMIGMENIKEAIFNKIILTLQGLNNKNLDYNHIVLYGSPGMGKTHVAKLIGALYSKMGFLSVGNFEQAKLTDLKAGYLGQTEIKTQKLLDKCKGSILFIDEAYSIGGEDKIDSFSQGIIDIINPYLDKHKDDFVLIIAGYKDDLNNRFFRGNQGLKSRFGLWLEIDKYTGEDLFKIFKIKIHEYEWSINDNISADFFKKNIDSFPYFGRDIENFFSKCKIEHAKRVLFLEETDKKTLNMDDITKGLELFINDGSTNKEEDEHIAMLHSGLYS